MAKRNYQFFRRMGTALSPKQFPWFPLLAIVAFAFVVVATFAAPWLLLVPMLAFAYSTVRLRTRRETQLKKIGYFSGSRHFDYWIYEERLGRSVVALILPLERTDPNTQELFIPDVDTWRRMTPSWAAERRTEIALRIAESWKPAHFHFAEQVQDA